MNDYYIPPRTRNIDRVNSGIDAFKATSAATLSNKERKSRERISSNQLAFENKKFGVEQDMAGEHLALTRRGQDITSRGQDVQMRGQDMAHEQAIAEMPEYAKKLAPSQVMKTQTELLKAFGPDTLKHMKPFVSYFEDLVKAGVTKGEAYQSARNSFDTTLGPALKKGFTDAWEQGIKKDASFGETQQGQAIQNALDGLAAEGPGIIDGFFGETKRSIDMERAKQEAKNKFAIEAPYKLASALRSLTHDKDGKPLEDVSTQQLEGLRQTANQLGYDIKIIDFPEVDTAGFNDKPLKMPMLIPAGSGGQIKASDIKTLLINDYGMSDSEANKYIDALMGK